MNGDGIERLISVIADTFDFNEEEIEMKIPFNEGWVLPYLHANGNVLKKEYLEEGIIVKVKINRTRVEKVREFIVSRGV